MRPGVAFALLLAACTAPGDRASSPAANDSANAEPASEPAPAITNAEPAEAHQPVASGDNPGLADMSPAQRRAYDLGYRDCSQGRYEPEKHWESYRIGCGAAQERIAAEER